MDSGVSFGPFLGLASSTYQHRNYCVQHVLNAVGDQLLCFHVSEMLSVGMSDTSWYLFESAMELEHRNVC
jgi:hypothetical protein